MNELGVFTWVQGKKKLHYNQSEVTGMNLGNYRLHNSFTYDWLLTL